MHPTYPRVISLIVPKLRDEFIDHVVGVVRAMNSDWMGKNRSTLYTDQWDNHFPYLATLRETDSATRFNRTHQLWEMIVRHRVNATDYRMNLDKAYLTGEIGTITDDAITSGWDHVASGFPSQRRRKDGVTGVTLRVAWLTSARGWQLQSAITRRRTASSGVVQGTGATLVARQSNDVSEAQ